MLAVARGDGRHARVLKAIERTELLILDDWGLSVLTPTERRDLLEILDDRQGRGSTIVTSQLPVDQWLSYGLRRLPSDWKPLHATPFMACSGGGWIVSGWVY